ncbi:unnamed protein product, partial [Allacma fusca]
HIAFKYKKILEAEGNLSRHIDDMDRKFFGDIAKYKISNPSRMNKYWFIDNVTTSVGS